MFEIFLQSGPMLEFWVQMKGANTITHSIFFLLGHYPGIDSDNNGDTNTEDARDDNTDTNKDDSGEENKHAELLNTCQLYPHYIWQLRAEYLVIYLL